MVDPGLQRASPSGANGATLPMDSNDFRLRTSAHRPLFSASLGRRWASCNLAGPALFVGDEHNRMSLVINASRTRLMAVSFLCWARFINRGAGAVIARDAPR
uniref:Uncharacterized protein n=1 Tax=Anopheles atroparvus TaxID=41427 RepID=A0A182IPH2_ANOAO